VVLTDLVVHDRGFSSGVALDLGAGSSPRNPLRAAELFALDVSPNDSPPCPWISRITCDVVVTPLPFDNQVIDFVYAFDFLEHIPRLVYNNYVASYPFIGLMNEVHRVLRPGGIFIAVTPAYPREGAFVDPTHVNFISRGTVSYFSDEVLARKLGYGFKGDFRTIHNDWLPYGNPVWHSQDTPNFRSNAGTDSCVFAARDRVSAPRRFVRLIRQNLSRINQTHHLMWVLQRPTER